MYLICEWIQFAKNPKKSASANGCRLLGCCKPLFTRGYYLLTIGLIRCSTTDTMTFLFQKGRLMYHKAHKGPEPIAYVDTRLYEGGNHDYYEVYDKRDLFWARRIDHLLTCYQVPRWTVK